MTNSSQKNKMRSSILSLAILTASLGLHAMASAAAVIPAEFSKARQLQFTAETFQKYLPQLVQTQQKVESFLVLASSKKQVKKMEEQFQAMGGDLSRLDFHITRYNSFWFQDFGPIYIKPEQGPIQSLDLVYNRYNRTLDDSVPESLSAALGIKNIKVNLNFEGGNLISDGQGRCFTSSRLYEQNPELSKQDVDQLMHSELGCRSLVVLEPLADDVTFHIDLFAKLVSLKTFIVGDFVDHKVNQERMNRNAEKLQRLGYKVRRLKVRSPGAKVYLTHLNSFLLNGTVLLPSYGVPEDQEATQLYQSLGFQTIQFPAQDLVLQGGSIHCVLRSLPN